MKRVTVSAPGKLHLSGEHAVVYGKPAVLVSTSKRLYVTLERGNKIDGQKLQLLQESDAFVNEIVKTFVKKYQITHLADIGVSVSSDISIGSGMGSSAALAVALIGALAVFHGNPWDAKVINELAHQAEKYKHVNSSGSDPAIVTHGGILWYRKELKFLKTFWLLPFKIPKTFAPFTLIDTDRIELTGDLVTQVGKLRQRNKADFFILISRIEEVTRQMVVAIHDEDEISFCQCIQKNERLLEKIGVVSASTKVLIREIEASGGVAKISGAGGVKKGSGIVMGIHQNPVVLTAIAKKYGYPSFQVVLAARGAGVDQVIV